MINRKNFNIAGNSTKLTNRAYTPAFDNYVVNDYKTTKYGQCINRLEDDADFCRNEVNNNTK